MYIAMLKAVLAKIVLLSLTGKAAGYAYGYIYTLSTCVCVSVCLCVCVITQQGGVCLIYTHDAQGCIAPESECVYIRQILTCCVITNILPTLY